MGIVHFAPVGTSPGAVTSALAHLQRYEDQAKGNYPGRIVESVVMFCSYEVERGDLSADDYIWNDYGRPNKRQEWRKPEGGQAIKEVIKDFLDENDLLADRGYLYAWPVDAHDYQACFEAVAQATLAMARSDATGKYVWANLTGGTNVLNAALMQVASLSGLVGRMYYTFVARDSDRRYLQPFSTDPARFDFVQLPLVKTTFDFGYYRLLEILKEDGEWHWGQELLGRLKNDRELAVQMMFHDVPFEHFKNQYLNRMSDDVLEEQKEKHGEQDRPVRISQQGREVLEYIRTNELVQALIHREQHNPRLVQACIEKLKSFRC